jgi:phosphatidate cytidylyltransferase
LKSEDINPDDLPTGEVPVVSPVDPRVTVTGAEMAAEAAPDVEPATESVLPHWTEAPTGQVPAVLSEKADSSDDPWASIPAPSWREGDADWVAHEEQFDASLLAEPSLTDDVFSTTFELDLEPTVREEEAVFEEAPRPAPAEVPARTRRRADANPLAGRAVRRSGQKNVSLATMTGIGAFVVVAVLFKLGTVPVAGLIMLAIAAATAEVFAAYRRAGAHPATLIGISGTVVLALGSYLKGESAIAPITAAVIFITFMWFLLAERPIDVLDGIGVTFFVYAWIGILASFAMLIISPVNYPHRHGLAFLMGALIVTIANDTGALFVGASLGKRHIVPKISPNKTLEGFLGGALVSLAIAAIVLPMIHPWTLKGAALEALALAVVVPLGDLFESLVKRTLGVKDMGELLPGHGGVADRIDGLLFALPVTYYLVHALHLG